MSDPKNEEAARVSFISNTRLICLRCHPQDRHPTNADHMVLPKMKVPDLFKMDAKGKITWGHLAVDTPKFIIESDASIVAPLMFALIPGW